ncbi:site-specific integrase [Bacillus mycoides]|uniref:site-specific integrase n=1 Tax=Bacillus mycoides TaxID=1405 RepID=UPI001C603DFA|nr:site-specific integrase [Bacillus mycoides]
MLKINNEMLEEISDIHNEFDINKSLIEAQILFEEYSDVKAFNKTGSFEDNIWMFTEFINGQTYYFNFDSFKSFLTFNTKLSVNEFTLVLKCWTISNLNSKTPLVTYKLFNYLYSICRLTKGFRNNFEEVIELIKAGQIYSKKHSKSSKYIAKTVSPETTLRFVNSFLSFSKFYTSLPVNQHYIEILENEKNKIQTHISNRDLPSPKEVLNFKDCIEYFFITSQNTITDTSALTTLTKFFPVILWWDLTSIIPMRPSEFCLIKRDCLSFKDNTLTFPRLKQKRNKKKIREELVYDTLPIPKELQAKITQYISLTTKYETSEYLISFKAFKTLTLKNIKSSVNYNQKVFNRHYLGKLIDCFYTEIIKNRYNLEFNSQLRPGDLRHIAIISMMMQGYDRVEIERLAGHFDINTQYSYVNHMKFWVDTDIQRLANQFLLQKTQSFVSPQAVEKYEQLYDDVTFNEFTTNKHPKPLDVYELNLGYCKDKAMPCPTFNWNFTGCYFCKHWGIRLSDLQENRELIIEELSTIYNSLQKKITYLVGLYNLNHLDELGQINPELKTELRTTLERIEHDKFSIARLQYLLGVEIDELK